MNAVAAPLSLATLGPMERDDSNVASARERISGLRVFEGCYEARRAAELSGIPRSTVYDWARKGIVVPSVSESRIKLWSYGDLLALRITFWFRQPKGDVNPTSMPHVREALGRLREMDRRVWDPESGESPIVVDRAGTIHLRNDSGALRDLDGQGVLDEQLLDPLRPFEGAGLKGPDLVRPRPLLRIIPGKVSGEPHIAGSRLTSPTVAALSRRGFPTDEIIEMYPHESSAGIREAVDLEREIAPAA